MLHHPFLTMSIVPVLPDASVLSFLLSHFSSAPETTTTLSSQRGGQLQGIEELTIEEHKLTPVFYSLRQVGEA